MLGSIATYAYLIYERMPLSYGELKNLSRLHGEERRRVLDRQAVVRVPENR
jgi:hypothetical protein